MDTPFITMRLYIAAPITAVWHALTDPSTTELYWDETRLESSWQPGEPLLYRRRGDVTDMHTLIEVQPPQLLVHSFRPLDEAHRNEVPSRVRIALRSEGPAGAITRLELRHDHFPVHSGVLPACAEGWPRILSSLKTLLETGHALPPLAPPAP